MGDLLSPLLPLCPAPAPAGALGAQPWSDGRRCPGGRGRLWFHSGNTRGLMGRCSRHGRAEAAPALPRSQERIPAACAPRGNDLLGKGQVGMGAGGGDPTEPGFPHIACLCHRRVYGTRAGVSREQQDRDTVGWHGRDTWGQSPGILQQEQDRGHLWAGMLGTHGDRTLGCRSSSLSAQQGTALRVPTPSPARANLSPGPLHVLCHGIAAGMPIVTWLGPLCSDTTLQVLLWSRERSNVQNPAQLSQGSGASQ